MGKYIQEDTWHTVVIDRNILKLVGLRLEQRGDRDWSNSVRMDDHMLVDKMKAEKIKMEPTTEIKVEAHMFLVCSIQVVGCSDNLV